jgi:hypothetical protein
VADTGCVTERCVDGRVAGAAQGLQLGFGLGMRFLLASLALVACGEDLQDDGRLDGMIQDAIDSGADSGPADADPTDSDAGEEPNPLAPYADEFDDPASLSDWVPRDEGDGTFEIEDGKLIATATVTGLWQENYEGYFLARGMIQGDFVMRAHLRVVRVDDPSQPPARDFNAVGLLARDPAGADGPESWAINTSGYQASGIGTRSALTYQGESLEEYRGTTGAELDLVLCRIGDGFRMYYLTPEYPDLWTNSGFFERPAFPPTLEVGIAIDSIGAQPYVRGEIDWIRFAVPGAWTDCTADIPPAP